MSSPVTANDPARSPSPPPEAGLQGSLGTADLVFTVLAFNAPLATAVGFVPVVIGLGNELGAPMAFLAAGAILGLFAVGFTAMGRHLPNPGAFYAYITAGLGRPAGLGASFLALFSYYFVLIGGYAFGGISLQSLVRDTFNGPDVAWWIWVLVLQAGAGVLGYLKIDLSARVLTVLLGLEVLMVLVYDAAVVFTGGPQGTSFESFTPSAVTSGSVGLALLFGITCFSGFEATAIFREEVRSPERTIPRATYIAIGFMATLYALGAWVMIQAYGPDHVVQATAADPTGSFNHSLQLFVGKAAVDIVSVLLCTSIFAANLSTHNVTTRYLYNLSVDGIFPRVLSGVHGRHGSPYRASFTTSVLALIGIVSLAVAGVAPATLYATLIGIGGYALIVLVLATAVAVLVYLNRHREIGLGVWHSKVAPVLAIAGLVLATVLATQNLDVLIGGSRTSANILLAVAYGLAALGFVLALVYRRTKPDVYARIGRQDL
ncbi:APC family permease [Streptomyces sp. NPDC005820]|uniref:APC family permease n=1 Tax=Streptomyces sp. NPDC005820 TaxID=3157069 RepID=UPI0033FCCE7D